MDKDYKIIDLSSLIYEDMEVYPGDPEVKIRLVHTYEEHSWQLRELSLGSHTGSHVDGISHMKEGGLTIDKSPLERFFGRSQLLGLADDWPEERGLFFIEEIGLESLDRLLDLKVRFVGGNISLELERALLERDINTYTGLVNLDKLPRAKDFIFFGLPLKIKDGDGSPVRAMALVEE